LYLYPNAEGGITRALGRDIQKDAIPGFVLDLIWRLMAPVAAKGCRQKDKGLAPGLELQPHSLQRSLLAFPARIFLHAR